MGDAAYSVLTNRDLLGVIFGHQAGRLRYGQVRTLGQALGAGRPMVLIALKEAHGEPLVVSQDDIWRALARGDQEVIRWLMARGHGAAVRLYGTPTRLLAAGASWETQMLMAGFNGGATPEEAGRIQRLAAVALPLQQKRDIYQALADVFILRWRGLFWRPEADSGAP